VVQADVPLGSVVVPGLDFGDVDFAENRLHLLAQVQIADVDAEPYSDEGGNTVEFGQFGPELNMTVFALAVVVQGTAETVGSEDSSDMHRADEGPVGRAAADYVRAVDRVVVVAFEVLWPDCIDPAALEFLCQVAPASGERCLFGIDLQGLALPRGRMGGHWWVLSSVVHEGAQLVD
jgi:hypothetical protein